MKKVNCLNCRHEQELTKIYDDELGPFTICEECNASFDIELEVGGYDCPVCGSGNSETYLKERDNFCLDCGYHWKLEEGIAREYEGF